jgi:hypothetical protein
MKIKVKVSSLMDADSSPLGSVEDRLIRVPGAVREKSGLETGVFLVFGGKAGERIVLQTMPSFLVDTQIDDSCLYVSKYTKNLLQLEKAPMVKPANDVLIGCDPEFFLVDSSTGFHISASHFFPHYGEVGNDCGLAELRPRPSFTAAGVVAELRRLITRTCEHLEQRTWMKSKPIKLVAASYWNNSSAGFHVHFGLPTNLLKASASNYTIIRGLISILDYYLGITSILPEGDEDALRRSERVSRYGKPGDYRADLKTLEYRVPGGHLLRHPLLTGGLMAMSIVVMKDALSRLAAYTDNFTKNVDDLASYKTITLLYPTMPSKEDLYKTLTSESIKAPAKYISPIFKDLTSMIGFDANRTEILEYFNYLVEFIGGKRKINEDILANWGITNERQSRPLEVLRAHI